MQTNQEIHNLTSEKLLTLEEVERRTGFRSSFIYKQIRNKAFPPPVKIGISSRWRESEVSLWIDRQIQNNVAGNQSVEAARGCNASR
ncbi:transcriptional regulator, AlpA family [Nitrosomonas nitrosa]|uniref:Transcriptional regulator, AlpA family n=1 Tax=Nitrosomonas nitrosa TaxID=52442 RepID=A0A1I4KSE2_9PROT|nr:AlpA family phage regulatory protein [Nitrosomonas nitrosa]SFL81742.1 transcriptional regulator, AlpA family [Nitrosomonas nitrosa]